MMIFIYTNCKIVTKDTGMSERTYISIDLKSFYASVEASARNLDPLTTNLVVADESRTEKTICLAVSPSLKAYGIPGRARLFEVVQKVKEVNEERRRKAPGHILTGSSSDDNELRRNPSLAVDYVTAPPRMALYMKISSRIFSIYLKYFALEDIHPYSIDEVFIDATGYLGSYDTSAKELARKVINDILSTTGITATAGIGPNLYLCKVALDIEAKHITPDINGVRIAELDEYSYRRKLWNHRPLTDFWRVGNGYASKLEQHRIYTMGDIARCSIDNEALLYRLFGINAELLIDHAWGWEPCTMEDIKSYKSDSNSIGSGQVLHCPYTSDKARIVLMEMADMLALDLLSRSMKTNQLVINIGYDIDNLKDDSIRTAYKGEIKTDRYGRKVPKHAHGTANLPHYTSSSSILTEAAVELFDHITDSSLLIRRLYITATRVISEKEAEKKTVQLDLFEDQDSPAKKEERLSNERRLQEASLDIKNRFGKNAILKGLNYEDGATARERNKQIGGHKA